MCEPVTIGLVISAGVAAFQVDEAKKAEKKSIKRADESRKKQELAESNIRAAERGAKTAKDLQSASDSDRASQLRKARGKSALRSPVPVLGGTTSQPALGGFGTPVAKPQGPKPVTALGGI